MLRSRKAKPAAKLARSHLRRRRTHGKFLMGASSEFQRSHRRDWRDTLAFSLSIWLTLCASHAVNLEPLTHIVCPLHLCHRRCHTRCKHVARSRRLNTSAEPWRIMYTSEHLISKHCVKKQLQVSCCAKSVGLLPGFTCQPAGSAPCSPEYFRIGCALHRVYAANDKHRDQAELHG